MDFLMQLLFEVYLNIGEIFVPEKKFKRWQETLLKILCLVACCCIFGCLGAGIAILIEQESARTIGIILTSVGSVLLAIQIALVVFAIVRDAKKQKPKKENRE